MTAPWPQLMQDVALFLYSEGDLTTVVNIRANADAMPGGGRLKELGYQMGHYYLNDAGDVVFQGTLDTLTLDIDGDGQLEPDQGIYVWSGGQVSLVAKTGMDLPGIGKLLAVLPPAFLSALPQDYPYAWFSAALNDRGQIPFMASVKDQGGQVRGVLLLATPADALFVRGDIDADRDTGLTDAIVLIDYLFLGGLRPPCDDAADVDDNAALELTDAVYLISYLFLGGEPPPAPSFHPCGPDATKDALDCRSFPGC